MKELGDKFLCRHEPFMKNLHKRLLAPSNIRFHKTYYTLQEHQSFLTFAIYQKFLTLTL